MIKAVWGYTPNKNILKDVRENKLGENQNASDMKNNDLKLDNNDNENYDKTLESSSDDSLNSSVSNSFSLSIVSINKQSAPE